MSALLTAAPTHAGGIYKWLDEQGNVHYGDRPPAGISRSEMEIEDSPVPTARDARRRQKTRRLLDAIESERRRGDEALAREQARSQQRETNCAIARRRVEILQRANNVSFTDDEGKRIYLDDDERADALRQAKSLVQKWC